MKMKILSAVLTGAMVLTGMAPALSVRAESGETVQAEESAGEQSGADESAEADDSRDGQNSTEETAGAETGEAAQTQTAQITEAEGQSDSGETPESEPAQKAGGQNENGAAVQAETGDSVEVNGTEYEYTVMLPEGYDANVEYSYPVVYMLPEDGYASWSEGITEELTEVMASDQSMDMIVVLPTFDEENDFRTVLQAVTENVDEDYRTLADSAHRAAAGVGVGGYMAYIAGLTDAQTGEALTSPSTYGLLASIRGDFVSDANPWYSTCGDVYDILSGLYDIDDGFYENYYTYMDTPVDDEYANMDHSTNDMGAMFIEWATSIPDYHEYTARPGSYDSAFLSESLNRIMSRFTSHFLSGIVSGSVTLERAAMTAQEEGTEAEYSFTVGDIYSSFAGNAQMDVELKLQVVDPDTDEVLYETTAQDTVTGPGTYEGTIPVENAVNNSSSNVNVTVNILGTVQSVGTASMIRIQETGDSEDEQLIDLMGDWYFNYVGRNDPYTAADLTEDVYSQWPVVQPCLGNWEQGFGNITNIWYANTGWGWYVRTFELPEDFAKENLILLAGYMDDRGEVYVNGQRIGGTGVNEDGSSTGETTWAVLSQFDISADVLNYGGTNTIAVHCYNDPPYGGGGWYSGPVGLYSQAAYNKWQGLPSDVPEESEQQAVTEAVETQLGYLQSGDFDSYADTVDIGYFSDGKTKDTVVQEMKEAYPEGTVQSLTDTDITVFQTTDESGETLYLYSAVRQTVKTDGTTEESTVQETYRNTENGILMYGTHSRFFETSYDSALAASAQGMEEPTTEERYLVYLPEGYFESDRYYPTVYLLHQYNSDHTSYMTDNVDQLLDQGMEQGLFDDMIVIVPNSEESSWWRGDWEKMITDELIPLIDSNYRTIRDARYRLTAGASMGGQGAYGVALQNPDLFSGAVSFFGAFSMGGESSPNVIAENESAEYLSYFTLYFICGNEDMYGFGAPAIELNKTLTAKGVDHYFLIENGDHNSEFYIPYFQSAFAYARSNMYQSDEAVTDLLSGEAAVNEADGSVTVEASLTLADGIESYRNTIPESSYTQDTVQSISVPVTLQVIQNGQVVYESSDKDVTADGTGTYDFSFDITGKVDTDQSYEIVWKAAVFDRVAVLAQSEIPGESQEEPGTEEPGTEEPGTEEPGTEEPGTEEPGTETPGTEEPGTEEPGTETPGTEEPGTETPGTDKPSTDDPSSDKPSTDKGNGDKSGTTDKGQSDQTSKAAKTGDSVRTTGTFVMFGLSVVVIVAALVLRKRYMRR